MNGSVIGPARRKPQNKCFHMEIERYITSNRAVCTTFNSIKGNCGKKILHSKLAQPYIKRSVHVRDECVGNVISNAF